jgi:hypothetical protein
MARLDRIEGKRDLAQLAATLGREFTYDVLAAVPRVEEPALQAELAKLVQAEILYRRPVRPAVPGPKAHVFVGSIDRSRGVPCSMMMPRVV